MRRRVRDRHVPLDFDRRENRPRDHVTSLTSRRRQLSRCFTIHKSDACRSFPPLEENSLKGRTSEGGGGGGCRAFVLPFCLHIPLFFFFIFFYVPSLRLHSSPSSLLISFLPRRRRMETLMRFGSRWLGPMHPTTTTSPRSHPPNPSLLMMVRWMTFC